MTVGQRWRLRRNLVIFVAARGGCSHRLLAEVFDLPRSRISTIIKQLRERAKSERRQRADEWPDETPYDRVTALEESEPVDRLVRASDRRG